MDNRSCPSGRVRTAPRSEAAERALVRRRAPDRRHSAGAASAARAATDGEGDRPTRRRTRRRRGGRGRGRAEIAPWRRRTADVGDDRSSSTRRRSSVAEAASARAGRSGRYLMCVHVRPHATQIAVLEGRILIEHYVSRPQDDVSQIHGNIYLGKVQNVLPGMEAAFVDIGTPKNAVLYRGDVQYDPEDVEEKGEARIEHLLRRGPDASSARSPRTRSAPRARGSPRRCRSRAASSCSSPTASTYGISKRLLRRGAQAPPAHPRSTSSPATTA